MKQSFKLRETFKLEIINSKDDEHIKVMDTSLTTIVECHSDVLLRLEEGMYKVIIGDQGCLFVLSSDTVVTLAADGKGLDVRKSEVNEKASLPVVAPCKSLEKTDIRDGFYIGSWGGYFVRVLFEDGTWSGDHKVDQGVRGMNCKCEVEVIDGWLYPN